MKPEIVHRIKIPIVADNVLSPQVHYGSVHHNEPVTGIYFNTQDELYGRITFENFDSLKIIPTSNSTCSKITTSTRNKQDTVSRWQLFV